MSVHCIVNQIRCRPCSECILCGEKGEAFYQNLNDLLFGVPGRWNLKKCPNPECGLIWLDPMPLEEDISKVYVTYYTHQDSNEVHNTLLRRLYSFIKEGYLATKYGYHRSSLAAWEKFLSILIYLHPLRRASIDNSVMYLPAKDSGRLLDVGCGSGQRLKLMHDMGWCVEGVDFDPAAVNNAKSKGLQVRLGKLETQKYPDNHFDAITMNHLIEHVHHPLGLLHECYRILKPGGWLVVVAPNCESWGHKIFERNWIGLDPPRHLYVFSMMTLKKLVDSASFKVAFIQSSVSSDYIFSASYALSKNEIIQNGHVKLGLLKSFMAKFVTFLQSIILLAKPNIGEEVVLIAEKLNK